MKKIFTLLFCVVAMGFAANASDFPMVDRCINALLGIDQPATLMASNLDANNDGMLSIADAALSTKPWKPMPSTVLPPRKSTLTV